MKITPFQDALNLTTFYDFAKLSTYEKDCLLLKRGILLDTDIEKRTLVNLYFLDGFFVERSTCTSQNSVIDIIPYKQGYRIKNFLEAEQFLVRKQFLSQDLSEKNKSISYILHSKDQGRTSA